jgi:hypothetical protein
MPDANIYIGMLIIALLVLCVLMYIQRTKLLKKFSAIGAQQTLEQKTISTPIQLQAYERLTLLTDRIALPSLITRNLSHGFSARDYQLFLIQTIKQEFEYNITQQIYVSADAWNAVRNLKEQNLLLINQAARLLPENATGNDFSRFLLELLLSDKRGTLHEVVSDVLSYEAKNVLG